MRSPTLLSRCVILINQLWVASSVQERMWLRVDDGRVGQVRRTTSVFIRGGSPSSPIPLYAMQTNQALAEMWQLFESLPCRSVLLPLLLLCCFH